MKPREVSFSFLAAERPDVLVLAGDPETDRTVSDPCLELFAELPCRKALVPGNHDISGSE